MSQGVDPAIMELIELAIAVMTALGLVYGGWRWARPYLARTFEPCLRVVSALLSLPSLAEEVRTIRKEVTPNGGSSLRDSVTRTERAVSDIADRVRASEAEARAMADSDPTVARFTCNAHGENDYVSVTYCRWLNVSRDQLLGWGFLTYVHPEDRDELREDWESARRDRRVYQRLHRVVASSGEIIDVDTIVTPVPEVGPVQRWVGVMRRVGHGRRATD